MKLKPNYTKLSKSFVVNTLTNDCSLKCESLDQIGQLNLSATAKYCIFLGSTDIEFAFSKNGLISNSGIILILSLKIENTKENSLSLLCILDKISNLYFSNSKNILSGAINSNLSNKSNSAVFESLINAENNIFASTTSSIYFSSLDNCLYCLERALLTFLPNLNASSLVNSLSLVKDFNIANCINFLLKASLATADQFISGNCSILCLTSSGTDNVIVDIFDTSLYDYLYYLYYVQIFKSFGCKKTKIIDFEGYRISGDNSI